MLAEDAAGRAVGVDGVLGDDVGVIGLFQADAVGVALLDGRAVGVKALAVDLQRVAVDGGQVADAGVAADAHHVLDLAGAVHPVIGELGAGDRHEVGLKAGALAVLADDVPDHQGKALLTVGGGVDVVDGDVGLQIEVLLGRVDGGVIEADAVGRVGRDELAALFVDGAVSLGGAGRHDDLAADAVRRADGVGRLAGRRAKVGKGPALAGVVASREGRRDTAGRHGCREQAGGKPPQPPARFGCVAHGVPPSFPCIGCRPHFARTAASGSGIRIRAVWVVYIHHTTFGKFCKTKVVSRTKIGGKTKFGGNSWAISRAGTHLTGGDLWAVFLWPSHSPLSHAAKRHDSSPVNGGAKIRPWVAVGFVVRRTYKNSRRSIFNEVPGLYQSVSSQTL